MMGSDGWVGSPKVNRTKPAPRKGSVNLPYLPYLRIREEVFLSSLGLLPFLFSSDFSRKRSVRSGRSAEAIRGKASRRLTSGVPMERGRVGRALTRATMRRGYPGHD